MEGPGSEKCPRIGVAKRLKSSNIYHPEWTEPKTLILGKLEIRSAQDLNRTLVKPNPEL